MKHDLVCYLDSPKNKAVQALWKISYTFLKNPKVCLKIPHTPKWTLIKRKISCVLGWMLIKC